MSNRNIHFLKGLQLSGLGTLGRNTEEQVSSNSLVLKAMLEKEQAQQEQQYKEGDTLSFDEIDKLHNANLTFEEKQAWVWFKRSQGVPMIGWDKYYLDTKKDKYASEKSTKTVVTNKATTVKDNHFRDIASVPKDVTIGSPTKFEIPYDKIVYLVFTTQEGYKQYVNKADVDVVGNDEKSEDLDVNKEIERLVKKGALFFASGMYLPYAFFSFGNMYDRQLALEKDKAFIIDKFGQDIYDNHLAVVERSKPNKLNLNVTDPRERPIILTLSPLARKADMFSISELNEETRLDLQNVKYHQSWDFLSDLTKNEKNGRIAEWTDQSTGQIRMPLRDAFRVWLYKQTADNFQDVSAYFIERYYLDKRPMGNKLSDEDQDTINKYAPQVGEELFARFLYEGLTPEDNEKLSLVFNRFYNGYADVSYSKVPIGFSCSAYFKRDLLMFSEAQREAIAYMEVAGSGLLAYDVGVGKTMSAIITLANSIQSGKCKRPLIVVPNPTYRKWIREIIGYTDDKTGKFIYGVLSGTGIEVNDFYNLGVDTVSKDSRGKYSVGSIPLYEPLPEKSITIVTYEGFKKMGLLGNALQEGFSELYSIVSQNDRVFKTDREEAKYEEGLTAALNKVNDGAIVDFSKLLIDSLIIDEAHSCKNVFEKVKADEDGNVRYQLGQKSSTMGLKAFFFCNMLIRRNGGNVMLLTATPFSNSPVEIFSMIALVGYKTLKDMKLNNLNTFMSTFVKQAYEYVNKVDGEIEMGYTVKSYANRQVLQKLIYSHILYKTGEDAGVQRPIKFNLPRLKKMDEDGRVLPLKKSEQILTYLEPTEIQREHQEYIEGALNRTSKGETGAGETVLGRMGKLLNLNLDNALSPYLLEKEQPNPEDFVEGSPKIKYVMECIKSVKEWHESRGESVSGQVIYCNRGKDYFHLMQRYLNAEIGFKSQVAMMQDNGLKRNKTIKFNEVEIIDADTTNDRREQIKEAFLGGLVKVLIGTSSIREGIDLQTVGSCLYILTPPWNATDIKQIEGRVWRQGNNFGYVRIVMPLLQDSMDVFIFQKLEEKTARVNDIWYKAGRGNVLDQESLDPEEIKLALFSKIEPLVKIRVDLLMKELRRKFTVNDTGIESLQIYQARYASYLAKRGEIINVLFQKNKMLIVIIQRNEKDLLKTDGWMEYPENRKKVKEELKDAVNLNLALTEFLNGSELDDKEILSFSRKTINVLDGDSGLENLANTFRFLISDVRKTERTLLTPRGYAPEDAGKLIEFMKEENKAFKARYQFLQTPEGNEEVFLDIVEQKEKYSVQGKSATERAKEFAELNYLLVYKKGEKAHSSLPAYSPEPAQEDIEKARSRRIRIAKAKLKLIQIQRMREQ